MDKQIILQVLDELIKLRTPWIQRKEVASWSAVLFYVAILWALANTIVDPKYKTYFINFVPCWVFAIITLTITIIIFFIFFRFIHSQYASIYNIWCHRYVASMTLRIMAFNPNFLDRFKDSDEFNEYLKQKQQEHLKKEVQKFKGEWHPAKIILYFWRDFIFMIARKSECRKLSNLEAQEGALYSLLIIITFIYLLFVYMNLYIHV